MFVRVSRWFVLIDEGDDVVKLTKAEQETIIRAAGDDKEWHVWSDDPKMVRKLKKQGWDVDGGFCKIPLNGITIRKRDSVENPKPRGRGLKNG